LSSSSRPWSSSIASSDSSWRDALRDHLRLELLADGIVDLVERPDVKIAAGCLDEIGAVLGLKRRDQIAAIRLALLGGEFAPELPVGGVNGGCDPFDKFVSELPYLSRIGKRSRAGTSADRAASIFSAHAAPRRFDRRE